MTQGEADELAWAKAKALAAQRGEAGNWACVMELFTRLRDRVEKAGGPFIGPRGGKWADAAHTIPWKPETAAEHRQAFVDAESPGAAIRANMAWRDAHYSGGPHAWLTHHGTVRWSKAGGHAQWQEMMRGNLPVADDPAHPEHEDVAAPIREWQQRVHPKHDAERRRAAKSAAAAERYERQGVEPEPGTSLPKLRGKKVWLYHGTSSALLPEIKNGGIDPASRHGKQSNVGASGMVAADPNHVYLTVDGGDGPASAGFYAKNAARKHGGRPVVLRVLVDGSDLGHDPDDADIRSGASQFVIDSVAPDQIMEVDGKRLGHRGRVQKAGGPFIGPRGGKWADAAHTIPWSDAPAVHRTAEDAHHAVRPEAVAAAHRAVAAGADPHTIRYFHAGGEGVLFTDKTGRIYKVGRGGRGRRLEALAGEALAAHGLGPKVHAYDAKHDVIVRDHVDGHPGAWADGTPLRKFFEEKIVPTLKAADLTAPEFKEDSFILGEDGKPQMVDVGFVQLAGKRLADELKHRDFEGAKSWEQGFDAQIEVANAHEDRAISDEEALAYMGRIGHEEQRKHGTEIIEFRAKHRPVAKGSVHHVPYTFHPVEVEPPRARRVKFPFQGFIDFQGLLIDVENKRGEVRRGTDADGHVWHSKMHAHYGEIRGTEGVDGDKLDVYVGPNADSSIVVVVHQNDPTTGKYDEDKVVLGYRNADEALALYRKQYDRNGFYGGHQVMPIGRFWRWVHDRANYGKRVSGGQIRKALGRLVRSLAWVEIDRSVYIRLRSQIAKGLAHKYLKRVPTGRTTKTGKPVYRYYYRLSGGAGDILHNEHVRTVGAAFKVEGGHVHIVSADGHGMVEIRHDETGKQETISETDLLRRLTAVHGAARQKWRNDLVDKVHGELARVRQHGTQRQRHAAERRALQAGVFPGVPPTAEGIRAVLADPIALHAYARKHGAPVFWAQIAGTEGRESRPAGDSRLLLDEATHSVIASQPRNPRFDSVTVDRMKVPESVWSDFVTAFRALPQDPPRPAPALPSSPETPEPRSLVLHGTDRYGKTKIEPVTAIVHGDYAIFRYPGGWASSGWRVAPVVDGKLGRPVSSVPPLNETEGRAWLAGLREEGVGETDESKLAAILRDRKADWLQSHAPKGMNTQQAGEFAAAQDAIRLPAPKGSAPKAPAPKTVTLEFSDRGKGAGYQPGDLFIDKASGKVWVSLANKYRSIREDDAEDMGWHGIRGFATVTAREATDEERELFVRWQQDRDAIPAAKKRGFGVIDWADGADHGIGDDYRSPAGSDRFSHENVTVTIDRERQQIVRRVQAGYDDYRVAYAVAPLTPDNEAKIREADRLMRSAVPPRPSVDVPVPAPAPARPNAPTNASTNAPTPKASPSAQGRVAREYGLRTTPAGRGDVHVSGNTFPNKDHLKRHGARPDRDAAGNFVWRMKASRFEDAMRELGRLQKGLGMKLRGLAQALRLRP